MSRMLSVIDLPHTCNRCRLGTLTLRSARLSLSHRRHRHAPHTYLILVLPALTPLGLSSFAGSPTFLPPASILAVKQIASQLETATCLHPQMRMFVPDPGASPAVSASSAVAIIFDSAYATLPASQLAVLDRAVAAGTTQVRVTPECWGLRALTYCDAALY